MQLVALIGKDPLKTVPPILIRAAGRPFRERRLPIRAVPAKRGA